MQINTIAAVGIKKEKNNKMEKQILEGLNFGLIEHAQIVTCRVLPRIKKCLESELHLVGFENNVVD